MRIASRDGILEPKEFEHWAKKYYSSFFNIFEKFRKVKINELKKLYSKEHIKKKVKNFLD